MIVRFLRKVFEGLLRELEKGDEHAIHLQPKSKKDMTACGLSSWVYGGMH